MQEHRYRAEIDGLRAVAVLPVIFFHAGYSCFAAGYLGVDVFFVISGFLICGILQREVEQGKFSIAAFYERRARRILPALVTVIAACVPAALLWMLPSDIMRFCASVLSATIFASNIYFWSSTDYFSPDAGDFPLLHLWSLGVEEQFYIFFPLLLSFTLLRHRKSLSAILISLCLLSLLLSEVGRRWWPLANFYLLPSRAWELLAGAMLTQYNPQIQRIKNLLAGVPASILAVVGLMMVLASTVALNDQVPSPSIYTLPVVAGSCLIIAFANSGNICGRVLGSPIPRFIGLISYSAYLWHQPIIVFSHLQPYWHHEPALKALSVVLSLFLAALSWRWVEQPLREKHRYQRPIVAGGISLLVTALAVIALWLGIPAFGQSLPTYSRGRSLVGQEIVSLADQGPQHFPCADAVPGAPEVQSCVIGKRGSPITVILWGDSYSEALLPGMDRAARARGIAVKAYVRTGCPPVLGLSRQSIGTCTPSTQASILNDILALPGHQAIVVFGNVRASLTMRPGQDLRLNGEPLTVAGTVGQLALTRHRLDERGKSFILLEQGPRFYERAARYYLYLALSGRNQPLMISRQDSEARLRPLRMTYGAFDRVIPTADFFCNPKSCDARRPDGRLVMWDREHVTSDTATGLANYVIDNLAGNR